MEIDPQKTITIEKSAFQLLLMIAGSILFFGLGFWLLVADTSTSNTLTKAVGVTTLLFGGFCLYLWSKMALRRGAVVITLSPEGFHDTRLSHSLIRWDTVQSLSEWQNHGSRLLMVHPRNVPMSAFDLKPIPRFLWKANAVMAGSGLSVNAIGVRISHDELKHLFQAYLDAHRSSETQDAD